MLVVEKDLHGEFRFPMFQVAADLDYLCNYISLQHFNHATSPCFRCYGNRDLDSRPITDLRPTAAWRTCLVDRASWFLTDKHILFRDARVGLNLFHVQLDILHMMDLGILQHLCASILYLFLFNTGLPGVFERKASVVWGAVSKAYVQIGTVAGERLTEDMFGKIFDKCGHSYQPSQYPELRCKGAIARHFVQVLLIATENMVDGAPGSLSTAEDMQLFTHVHEVLSSLHIFMNVCSSMDCGCRLLLHPKLQSTCERPACITKC